MDKDEPEKNKLFMSQTPLNKNYESKESKSKEIKLSIYKVKNKKPIEMSDQNVHQSQKNLTYSNEGNKTINGDIDNNNKKITNKNKVINQRYNLYENEEGFEDDEISENNTPKEKPDKNIYNKTNLPKIKQENLQISSELNKILQSSSKKDIKLLKNEIDNNITEKLPDENNPNKIKEMEEIEKFLENEYIPHKKYIDKSNFFIMLFSLGIIFSFISGISCIFLELYSNQDVFIIIGILSIVSIIIYVLWIIFILKDKKYVLLIINSRENPEKINNSKYRKTIILMLYWCITILNYFVVFMLVNTLYLNNTKLSIKGKAYDINQWSEIFSDKNYSEIIKIFERNNIVFLVFGWLNYLLMLFIYIYQFCLLMNYRLVKSTLQILCLLAIQGGIYQIYLSLHCYVFRDITSDEGIKISWVTPGTIVTGCISIILGIYGFYVFFIEHKKGIIIFQICCVAQYILLLVFTVGLGSIQDKFYNYKKANCNSLFKFISEDYLIKNKYNGCTSKYLFTTDTLENMQCPKERIMLNWERTESLYSNSAKGKNNMNDINIINNKKKDLFFGCINQSCCLQTYFGIKNKFDLLFILSAHQLLFFFVIFINCFYINCKLEDNLEEEYPEKINILIFIIATILILFTLIPYFATLPKSSNQSKLNLLESNEVSESLSIIDKGATIINLENLYSGTNSSFNEIKQKAIDDFKYNIIFDYLNDDNFNYSLSNYEYSFVSEGLDIMINNNTLKKINFYNFQNHFYSNSTQIIGFRTKSNLINNIFEYFNFFPRNPLKNDIYLNIDINAIYSEKNEDDKGDKMNEIIEDYKNIIISGKDIINNYNEKENNYFVKILKKEIDFSIMNKSEFIYIKGNINNDDGNSIINVYNNLYNNESLFSTKSEPNGTFLIGPIYRLNKSKTPYYFTLEISKIKYENQNEDLVAKKDTIYKYDENYCKYYELIKIDEYAFKNNGFYSIKNINLPKYMKGNAKLYGDVIQYDEKEDKYLSYVEVKLFYGDKINKVLEHIELNSNNLNTKYLDEICIDKTSTNKKGDYNFNIHNTGQYMLLFIKDDFYIEKNIFTLNEINEEDKIIELGTKQLVKLFNSGKLVVKLEWDVKPPDLDLICRFQVTNNFFCYTFFGNKQCGETEFFIDNITPDYVSSEIIEISEFSDYIYLFYVRKYFDTSNGKTQNEYKISGVDNPQEMNKTETYILYNEYLNNTSAYIYVYSNGYKIPSIKIPIPDYQLDDYNCENEYIYWAAFCINGNEGINSLKIINKYMENEPPKNICLSYYDDDKISKF